MHARHFRYTTEIMFTVLVQNLKEVFPGYYVDDDIINRSIQSYTGVLPVSRGFKIKPNSLLCNIYSIICQRYPLHINI